MSHFTVLVPATNEEELDALLLPYYEYGCSTEYDERVKPFLEFRVEHETDSFERDAKEIIGIVEDAALKAEYEALFAEGNYAEIFERWDGGELHDGNWGYWRNPNAKWDWYVIGGRWSGAVFGDGADCLLVGEIDLEYLREKKRLDTELCWLDYLEFYGLLCADVYRWLGLLYHFLFPVATKFKMTKKYRNAFWGLVRKLSGDKHTPDLQYGVRPGESRRRYVERNSGALTWALITREGEWLEKAEMGWWGLSSNYQGKNYFNRFWEEVLSWSPEQRMYVVDCHI